MREPGKLHQRHIKVLSKARRDGGIMLTHDPGGPDFYCTLAGQSVAQQTVKELLTEGFLEPADDGLFPGDSQVFIPK